MKEFEIALENENYDLCAKLFNENAKKLEMFHMFSSGKNDIYNLFLDFFKKIYKNYDIVEMINNNFKYIFIGDIESVSTKKVKYYKLSNHIFGNYRICVIYENHDQYSKSNKYKKIFYLKKYYKEICAMNPCSYDNYHKRYEFELYYRYKVRYMPKKYRLYLIIKNK